MTVIAIGLPRAARARVSESRGLILRYADAGGRPTSNSEFSMRTLARDRALELKVYDEREASQSG